MGTLEVMAKNKAQTEDTSSLTDGQDTGHTEQAGSPSENPNTGMTTDQMSGDAKDKDDPAADYQRQVLGDHPQGKQVRQEED
jgi:hypothetical protein